MNDNYKYLVFTQKMVRISFSSHLISSSQPNAALGDKGLYMIGKKQKEISSINVLLLEG